MAAPEQISSPWVDIPALPAPVEATHLMTIFIGIAAVILCLTLVSYIWRRPRLVALRQLRNIQRQTPDARQQLFLIRRTLQQGLQTRQLHSTIVAPDRQRQWQQFCHDLVRCCYQAGTPTPQDVTRLRALARDWLRQA